jgi:hypothetical protein
VQLVHRIAYAAWHGGVCPPVLDHLCRERHCFNPAHLESVTHRQNILRGTAPSVDNYLKTHCKHGHPFDETNTVWRRGHRQCLICDRRRGKEAQARYRGKLGQRVGIGQSHPGESNPSAKLTAVQVGEIRSSLADGATLRPLAASYGVSERAIQFI